MVDLNDGSDKGFGGFPGIRKEKSEGAARRANMEDRLRNLPQVQLMNEMMKAMGKMKADSVETILHSGMTPQEVEEAIQRALGAAASSRPKSGSAMTMAALEQKLRGMSEKQLQEIMSSIPRETLIEKIDSFTQDQLDKFITRAMLQDALGSLGRNQVGSLCLF